MVRTRQTVHVHRMNSNVMTVDASHCAGAVTDGPTASTVAMNRSSCARRFHAASIRSDATTSDAYENRAFVMASSIAAMATNRMNGIVKRSANVAHSNSSANAINSAFRSISDAMAKSIASMRAMRSIARNRCAVSALAAKFVWRRRPVRTIAAASTAT